MPRHDADFLQSILKGDSIDDCSQKPHLIGRNSINALGRSPNAAEDIAPSDHDGDLDAETLNLFDFLSDGLSRPEINPERMFSKERLSRKLEQDAGVGGFRRDHESSFYFVI